MTSERSKCHHVYEHHLLVANGIALGKRPEIAHSGIIDQETDINPFMIQPGQQVLQLFKICEISFAKRNRELRMLLI